MSTDYERLDDLRKETDALRSACAKLTRERDTAQRQLRDAAELIKRAVAVIDEPLFRTQARAFLEVLR